MSKFNIEECVDEESIQTSVIKRGGSPVLIDVEVRPDPNDLHEIVLHFANGGEINIWVHPSGKLHSVEGD